MRRAVPWLLLLAGVVVLIVTSASLVRAQSGMMGVGRMMGPGEAGAGTPGGGFAITTQDGEPLSTQDDNVLVTQDHP